MPITRRGIISLAPALLAIGRTDQAALGDSRRSPIRIGQIGVGHGHASKLAVYRDSPEYEVVGIVEPDEQLRESALDKPYCRGLNWMTRDELLETPGLQAVLIETRVGDLLDNAEACVLAGKHVHVDKPAGQSIAHFRRILDLAKNHGLLVQMGYMYRYNPAIILLREFLSNGWLGEVFEVHSVMSKVVEPPARLELAKYRGGMMFELGCHLMDLTLAILGRPTAVKGYFCQSSNLGDSLLDNCLAVLEYPKAIATIKSSALEVEGFDRRHLVVCGTKGTFHVQPLDNPVVRLSLSQECGTYRKGTQEIKLPRYTRYVADAIDMAKIIRGEKVPDFTSQHDFLVQETLLRACGLIGE